MVDMMSKVVAGAISLLILVVIFYLGPGLGEEISTALPINASGDFADATTGADVWTSGVAIVTVVVIIIFISLAINALYGLRGKE
ncbi:MAG: hypothetical protein WCQ65_12820 [Fermentimonas sp.]